MAFNIRLLDKLSYDEVEPILLDYIDDVIEVFVDSDLGQAQIKANPEGGQWIGTFIEVAYQYGEMTLPQMTKADVQVVMEQIIPAKITLADRSETEGAIAELVAFWTFLKQEYRLRSTGAIAKYLKSIEGQFTDWMFDPNRGGFAKQFVLQGLEAGYDMQSQEGIEAFQQVYNDRIAADPSKRLKPTGGIMPVQLPEGLAGRLPNGRPSNVVDLRGIDGMQVPLETAPDDLRQMMDALGIKLPPEGGMVNPAILALQMLNALENLDEAEQERLVASLELEDEPEVNPSAVPLSSMMASIRQSGRQQAAEALSAAQEKLLQATEITEAGPGTILRDFQMLLDAIGPKGIPVSASRHQFALKLLRDLNGKLVHPIDIDLNRPSQKSFPPLNGLYLLLRATGLVRIVGQGKKFCMVLHSKTFESWQQLNPTERYFTLLEAWLIRAHPEMLGEERSPLNEGSRVLREWHNLAAKQPLTFAQYKDQDRLDYWPGFSNLCLMEMFGLIKITHGKPGKGKGWRMKGLEVLPLGKAIMPLCQAAAQEAELMFESEMDPTLPFTDFQPKLQPYFPQWQQSLATPSSDFKEGRYIFKVSMAQHPVWRRLAIASDATLEDFSALIFEAFEFEDPEHLDAFTYKNQVGRNIRVMHPMAFDSALSTHQVQIGKLPLAPGETMEYVFDLGACWEFNIQLETIEPLAKPAPSVQVSGSRKPKLSLVAPVAEPTAEAFYGEVLEGEGDAPPQYPEDDDW